MQLEPNEDQLMMTEMFSRFLDVESTMERVRAAIADGGFDAALWAGLGEQGAFAIRLPEVAGGLGLGIFDAGLLMEQAGRTLASGPLAEQIVAIRLLASLDPDDALGLRDRAVAGTAVVTIAMADAANQPHQLVAGGAAAHAVLYRQGSSVRVTLREPAGSAERTVASTPIDRVALAEGEQRVLAEGAEAVAGFAAAIEEWKLLIALQLAGLSKEAVRLASAYACERQQFGRPIGSYQAISHPLALCAIEADAGKLMAWRAIRAIADGDSDAGEQVSLALWWSALAAEKTVAQSLHTFGGYGLTLEYDIHLYNLRAKALPLIAGDPEQFLAEAARRRYAGERAALPDAGPMPVEFGLGEDAEALAAETRALFERVLTPELRAKAHYSYDGHDPYVHQEIGRAGLLVPNWPVEYGGRGCSPYAMEAALRVWDEYGWTTHMRGTVNIIGFIIARFGSEELKAEALTRILAGEAGCALGFSEPGSGSDVFAAKTRATREGNGWRIDGQKMFTSGAEHSDYAIMLCRTDPDAPKHRGLTMFIVPLKAEGVTIQAVHTFQEERTNITYYDSVRIPDSWRLGEVGGGLTVMAASLEIEQGMTFAREHFELLRSAEELCREIVRNGKPLIEDPAVQARLAKTQASQLAAQALHFRTLWVNAEKKENLAYGPASKMYSSEVYRADAADLLNLTAPESLAFASKAAAYINQSYRHAQVATVYGGTSEVHRSMVAEKQLGLPRTR